MCSVTDVKNGKKRSPEIAPADGISAAVKKGSRHVQSGSSQHDATPLSQPRGRCAGAPFGTGYGTRAEVKLPNVEHQPASATGADGHFSAARRAGTTVATSPGPIRLPFRSRPHHRRIQLPRPKTRSRRSDRRLLKSNYPTEIPRAPTLRGARANQSEKPGTRLSPL